MAKNSNLGAAKAAKNDEYYTQYKDIQNEVNAYIDYNPDVFRDKTILLPCDDPEWSCFTKFFAQNFERFGLKKLISTSYAVESKIVKTGYSPTFFEKNSPNFDELRTRTKGKKFVLDKDANNNGYIDIDDLQWEYMDGDGDFNSNEVKALRDESDIIVTNPPFSLFRNFVAWIMEAEKSFLILGNLNAISYKEIFPLIKSNKIWLGTKSGTREYLKPDGSRKKMGNTMWFTNIEHGQRHKFLQLMTMAENIKFSKHKEIKGTGYLQYDNYDAIDIPSVDAIPSDYNGYMGVPLSFLDKYCPEQFEIVGITDRGNEWGLKTKNYTSDDATNYNDLNRRSVIIIDGQYKMLFPKLLIKKKV